MARFFIDRPNFAWVVAIFIMLAGLLAMRSLPVSQYPNVAPPQISISASYPGASASTVADTVISVIEEELNGVKGLLYFDSSSSSTGSGSITVTFRPGTNPDLAQVEVQNRIKKAEASLPTAVTQEGLSVEQENSGFLALYTLSYRDPNDSRDIVELADYAARNINNEIRRVPGVGDVQFFSSEAAMRVWVDPQKLLSYDLTITDVNKAIAEQNAPVSAGSFGARPAGNGQELMGTIALKGTLDTPEEFARIILKANPDGSKVTLGDVARLEIGRQDYSFETIADGGKAVGAAVQLAPGANALQTAKAVKRRLEELSQGFPPDMQYAVPFDTSRFVEVAIEKVVHTLIEAVVLVFFVMFLFLQNFRATLIPSIVVPVCLSGTLAVMYGLGFSVNMMTMFGMVLAIGILVDDAIVVVENVERIMSEEGSTPKEATIKAMQQVSGAIVGITLALSSVFLPLAFMSGSVGVIYRQFSLSLVVSILFSGFLALTLTPALCATLLKPVPKGHHVEKKGPFGWFNRSFASLTHRFEGLCSSIVKRTARYMVIYALIVSALGYLYSRLPESFVPDEDQGYYLVDVQLPPGATYARSAVVIDELNKYMQGRDAMAFNTLVLGYSFSGDGENAALGFPVLKDWSERGAGETTAEEIDAFNARFANLKDGRAMAMNPPAIEGLGNSGGFSLRLQDRASLGVKVLLEAGERLVAEANESPVIVNAMMERMEDAPQLRLNVNRGKAEALGVGFATISNAVSTAFGSASVADFVNGGRQQSVVVQADSSARMTPENVLSLNVPNVTGDLVPLSSFTTVTWELGPKQIARYNGYLSISISGDAASGYSSGQAMEEMQRLISHLPQGIAYEWTGLSYQEKFAGAQAPMLLALSFLVVFLLLVALYESWLIASSVMLIVPIGAIGAVLAVMALGMPNDVYFKVGLITIIGLSAKNAILIVEFAKSLHEQGVPLLDAAAQAARLRFRPIVMTSMAFILGVVPLAIASGAGAAGQRAIGTGVIGGMLSATVLGVLFAPVFFVWVLKFKEKNRVPAPVPELKPSPLET